MSDNNRLLSLVLIVSGVACCLIYPLSMVWPSGWAWHEGSPASNDYFMMIVGVYATLGVFLIRAAKDPAANASLIWFTVWSSIVHAGVMAAEAVAQPDAARPSGRRRAGADPDRHRAGRADGPPGCDRRRALTRKISGAVAAVRRVRGTGPGRCATR